MRKQLGIAVAVVGLILVGLGLLVPMSSTSWSTQDPNLKGVWSINGIALGETDINLTSSTLKFTYINPHVKNMYMCYIVYSGTTESGSSVLNQTLLKSVSGNTSWALTVIFPPGNYSILARAWASNSSGRLFNDAYRMNLVFESTPENEQIWNVIIKDMQTYTEGIDVNYVAMLSGAVMFGIGSVIAIFPNRKKLSAG